MLDLTITKEVFEFVLPVFQSPTEHLFERLAHEIDVATEEAHALIGDYADKAETKDTIRSHATAWICCVAARKTLPQLDLVLTETGFGVVSNQNIVPASQARVSALNDSLRQKASRTLDRLLLALLSTPWRESAVAIDRVSALFWLPSHCRRHGVTFSREAGIRLNPLPVYDEEFDALRASLAMAESKVATLISPELYEYLIEQERLNQDSQSTALTLLVERCRSLVAAFMKEQTHPKAVQQLIKRVKETLEQYKGELDVYTSSATYKAQYVPVYENKKEDSTFFFS